MKRALLILGLIGSKALAIPDVVPTQRNESSQSTFDREFAATIGTDTAEAGSTAQVINATAHAAVIGDILRFTTVGSNYLVESHVSAVTANTITLTRAIPAAPTVGDGFTILRLLSPSIDTSGSLAVSGSFTATNPSVGVNGAAIPASSTLIGAKDTGGFLQALKLDAGGALVVSSSGIAGDSNYGTPTSSTPRSASMLGVGSTAVSNANPVPVSDAGGSLTVDAVSWPLPTGASTSALQTTGNTSLSSIDSKLTSPLAVTGTFFQATQPVSAASLPLPTGASTSALQTTGNTSLASIDSKLTSPITVTGTVTANNASVSATGAAVPASATFVGGTDGTNLRALKVSSTGVLSVDGSAVTQPVSGTFFQATQPVSAVSLPLPTGAATSANQTTAQTSLSSIDSKLTSPLAVTGTFFQATQPVSGTVAVTQSTSPWVVSGTVTTTPSALDFGVSSAAARTAAQIGNATGAAAFGSGASNAQTLRTVLATDQSSIPITQTPLSVTGSASSATDIIASTDVSSYRTVLIQIAGTFNASVRAQFSNDNVNFFNAIMADPSSATATPTVTIAAGQVYTTPVVGRFFKLTVSSYTSGTVNGFVTYEPSATGPLKTAQHATNFPTSVAVNGGVTNANTLRVVLPTDQTPIPVTESGTFTIQPGNTANTTPWLFTINQGGNSATVSAGGALKVDGSAVTQPVSGTVTANQGGAPWTVTGTGTAGTAAAGVVTVQGIAGMTAVKVDGSAVTQPVSIAGTVTTTISGSSLDHGVSSAALRVVEANGSYADSVYRDYSSGAVTTGAWTQLIASTAANIHHLLVSDTCGEVLELGTGAAASETRILIIPRGGVPTLADITIPSGTRLSLRAVSATCPATAGTEITITGIN